MVVLLLAIYSAIVWLIFTAGASDLLDVQQLQTRQLSARFDLNGVRNDRLANRVALHLALGGGFTQTAVP